MAQKHIFFILYLTLLVGCKSDKKQEQKPPEKEVNILEKIANANGYPNWKDVSSITYTFNVDRDSSHFERTWTWRPKSNDVSLMTSKDTLHYNRKSMDSIVAKTDRGFINDKFWLLGPYQLVWDKNSFAYDHTELSEAPISKKKMHKLIITYGEEGGYTPGDAYDFYFEDDFIIKEWVFRKGNQEAPSMMTSWEDYKQIKGLNIATMHKKPDDNFQLYFTGIKVE